MKKLILLLLFIPLVSFGQKKSLLTKSGVSLTFDKPEGMKESSSGAAINPNVLVQYVNENNIGGYTIIANIIPFEGREQMNNMKKENIYQLLAEGNNTTDSAGNSLKLIDFKTLEVNDKLFGWSLVEQNSIYNTVNFYYYTKNTIITSAGTDYKSGYEDFYEDFIDFVWSIEINGAETTHSGLGQKKSSQTKNSISIQSILDSHLNAIGGIAKLSAIKSLTIKASVTIPGAPFKPNAIIKEKYPNKFSMEMSVPDMGTLMIQKFNGEDGYIEQMGQKIPYDDEQKTEQKKKLGLFEEAYLDSSKMEIVSLSQVDGKDVYKIKLKDKSFRFYDVESGLLIMTEETTTEDGNELKTITKFSDYKEVDGVKFAFKSEIMTGSQTIVIESNQIIINEEIADNYFN